MKPLFPCLLALWAVVACAAPTRADDAPPREMRIEPATTSVPLGKAKLNVASLVRSARGDAWQGDYTVEVSPLSFANEQGKLVIDLPSESLRRLTNGQPVDFTGQADSASGNHSNVQGNATPAAGSKDTGAIRVRIDSRKGRLVFKTTYRLVK